MEGKTNQTKESFVLEAENNKVQSISEAYRTIDEQQHSRYSTAP